MSFPSLEPNYINQPRTKHLHIYDLIKLDSTLITLLLNPPKPLSMI